MLCGIGNICHDPHYVLTNVFFIVSSSLFFLSKLTRSIFTFSLLTVDADFECGHAEIN